MAKGKKHNEIVAAISRARALGPVCVVDLATPSCYAAKTYLPFMLEDEVELMLATELARPSLTPPKLPRPTVLARIQSRLVRCVSQRVGKIIQVTPALAPNGRKRQPRPKIRKPTLRDLRPSNAHKAGDAKKFYEQVKLAASMLADGSVKDVG
jgi:hypothetical protein